jgi:hypothetical protein
MLHVRKLILPALLLLLSTAAQATTYLYDGVSATRYLSYGVRWAGGTMDSYLQAQVPLATPAPFERLSSLGIEFRSFGNMYLDPTFYNQISLDPLYELIHSDGAMLRAYIGPIIVKSASSSLGITPHAGLVSSLHIGGGFWFDPATEVWSDAHFFSASLAALFRVDISSFLIRFGTKVDYFMGPASISSNNTAIGVTGNFWAGYIF